MVRHATIRLMATAAGVIMGLMMGPLPARAAEGAATPPPPLLPDRTAEDHGFLRDPARRGDWTDGYKNVPLDADGDVWASFGADLRERIESFDAPRFGIGGVGADTYGLQRALAHVDLRVGPHVRLFAQVGAHHAFGKRTLAAPDEDRFDVQQLFVELRPAAGLSARLGRQEMLFNPLQRFVSFRDGTNVRQNFDGARFTFNRDRLRAEAFLVRPVALERGTFDNEPNDDQSFAGVYAGYRLGARRRVSLDLYWFRLGRDALPVGPLAGDEVRHSVGVRSAGTHGRFDWDGEALLQRGDSVGRDIRAWALSLDTGFSLAAPLRPRLGLRFDAGSGDSDPSDNVAGGFHPLFPAGPYFNEANLTSWTNLVAVRPSLRVQPEPRLTITAAVQLKWRENVADFVYIGPSNPLPGTTANRHREIGQAYTLDLGFQLNRHVHLRAYYLHHSAGDAIRAAGGAPVDFGMGAVTLRF